MKNIFEAIDGTQFETELECAEYDFVHSGIHVLSIYGDELDKQDILNNPRHYSLNPVYFASETLSCDKDAISVGYIIIGTREERHILDVLIKDYCALEDVLTDDATNLFVGVNIFQESDYTVDEFGSWSHLPFKCVKNIIPVLQKAVEWDDEQCD